MTMPAASIGLPRRRPGAYTKILTLQSRPETSQDEWGEYDDGNTTVVSTHYCSLEPIREAERRTGSQIQPERQYFIETWYFDGVVPKQSWLFGTRVFEIVEVINEGEKDVVLRMRCNERDV